METNHLGKRLPSRIPAIDLARGFVMVLMLLDHASSTYNSGRLVIDGASLYQSGSEIPFAQFVLRFVTHICAPTFVFLAGTSLALNIDKQRKLGVSERRIDLGIGVRGLILIVLELFWVQWWWQSEEVILQVIFAIGVGFILMTLLRRLNVGLVLFLGLALLISTEEIGAWIKGGRFVWMLLVQGGSFNVLGIRFLLIYPILQWLAVMILGWIFGHYLLAERERGASDGELRPEWFLVGFAVLGIGGAVALRALNGYGNEHFVRESSAVVQWMLLSKYPPSLSYLASQLGAMALLLAIMFAISRRSEKAWWEEPLTILGQSALFFYLAHLPLLKLPAVGLGVVRRFEYAGTILATALALVLLYPLCRWYRRVRRERRGIVGALAQFV